MVGVALAINGLGGGSSPAEVSPVLGGPFTTVTGLAADASGTLYVGTASGWATVAPDGTTTPVDGPPAGTPQPGDEPTDGAPGPIAHSPDGAVFYVDGTTVRRRAADGSVLTVAGGGTRPATDLEDVDATDLALPDVRGLAVDAGGHVYVSGSWGLAELSPGGELRLIDTDHPIPPLAPLTSTALGVVIGAADTQLVRVKLAR
jgi:hypothetical protein